MLIENRLYAIKLKLNNKVRFVEEVTFLKQKDDMILFSKLSWDGKKLTMFICHPNDIKVYKRIEGEWTEFIPYF